MDYKSKIILIAGPTASGKSKIAINLAKKINGEIVNADSMQVYKQLKILSARPDPKKYQKIKHHLYGFHNVTKNFSTGDWLKLVIKKIKEVKKRKKTPILVGGTGLYFKALTDGLVKIPNISLKLRTQIRDLQKKLGQKKFYERLLKLDPIIQSGIRDGFLSMGHGRALINIEDKKLQIEIYEQIISSKLSVRQTEKIVKGNKTLTLNNSNSDVSKIYIDATNKFERLFDSKVTLKENNKGKVTLSTSFKSINELYSILKKISN